MPKGYVIAHIDVTDPETYPNYMQASSAAIKAHGGRVLARGGRAETLEGHARARNVLVEFESYEAARAFYDSEEYRIARKAREGAALFDLTVFEGA